MDRRILILPLISIALILVLLARPDITGFMVASPAASETGSTANISITIAVDGFIPEDSVITVYLDGRNSSMGFSEFVKRTGTGYNRVYDENPRIGYAGYGYAGEHTYSLDVSAFGFDASAEPGAHELVLELMYGNYVLSNTSEIVELG